MTKAGMSKLGGDPGLHNKPLGFGASQVYASDPDSEEEEEYVTSLLERDLNILSHWIFVGQSVHYNIHFNKFKHQDVQLNSS